MPLNFGNLFPPSPVFVNYDWVDIANGLGYETYYGYNAGGTVGTSPRQIYSGIRHYNGTKLVSPAIDVFVEALDVDFDITFNTPKNIKGDILLQLPFGVVCTSNSAGNKESWIRAISAAYHYDGATETIISGVGTSEAIYTVSHAANIIVSHITTLKLNVATMKHFKKGETLRITIQVYIKHSQNAASYIGGVGCDPQNRSDVEIIMSSGSKADDEWQVINTDEPTRLEIHVPFKLDI